jgi:hypothetical protein
MKPIKCLTGAAAAIVAATVLVRAQDERAMPLDRPVEVNGYDLVCTGVGDEARDDPRWREYPVRIEFANRDAQYLANIDVAVADADGKLLFAVLCESPWLLAKLPPGKYTATGVFGRDIQGARDRPNARRHYLHRSGRRSVTERAAATVL